MEGYKLQVTKDAENQQKILAQREKLFDKISEVTKVLNEEEYEYNDDIEKDKEYTLDNVNGKTYISEEYLLNEVIKKVDPSEKSEDWNIYSKYENNKKKWEIECKCCERTFKYNGVDRLTRHVIGKNHEKHKEEYKKKESRKGNTKRPVLSLDYIWEQIHSIDPEAGDKDYTVFQRDNEKWTIKCHICEKNFIWNGIQHFKLHTTFRSHSLNIKHREIDNIEKEKEEEEQEIIRFESESEDVKPIRKRSMSSVSFEEDIEKVFDISSLKELMVKKYKQDQYKSFTEYNFKAYTDELVAKIGEEVKNEHKN